MSEVVNKRGKNPALFYRVATSVLLIPVIALFVFLGGWYLFALGLGIAAIATREFTTIIERAGYRPMRSLTLALSLAFIADAQMTVAGLLLPGDVSLGRLALSLAMIASLIVAIFRDAETHQALTSWAFVFAGAIYVGWLLRYYLLLRGLDAGDPLVTFSGLGVSVSLARGTLWLVIVMGSTWLCDTTAYFVGSSLGRRKLLPRISPSKTWEGTLGGIAAACVGGTMAGPLLGVALPAALGLGLTIGIAAVLGDLAESLIKRGAHVKDASSLIPGHGGLLDRLDSMLFTGVAAYYYLVLTQLVHLT
ncbi:MAG: phosphatidate cytidylyltransferase [Chloroflexota bacterium]